MQKSVFAAAAAALVVSGCSSRPREFTPSLAYAPADQARFDSDFAECKQLIADGKLDANGRSASAGAGAAAGAAAVAAGGTAAAALGGYAGLAAASATVVLLPLAVVGGAVGMAKAKRHKKEVALQRMLGGCLEERGYRVVNWQKAPKATSNGQ